MIKRGSLYWVEFDPSVDSEIQKTRPAVIVSNRIANELSPIVMLIPLTSKKVSQLTPTQVFIEAGCFGLKESSKILVEQMRAVDKKRVKGFIGTLSQDVLFSIDRAIKIHLSLDEFNLD